MKRNKSKKIIMILGYAKNIILYISLIISILILINNDFLFNNFIIEFLVRLLSIINMYCFLKVNAERLINS